LHDLRRVRGGLAEADAGRAREGWVADRHDEAAFFVEPEVALDLADGGDGYVVREVGLAAGAGDGVYAFGDGSGCGSVACSGSGVTGGITLYLRFQLTQPSS
jgi:hypothetical protein